jgi:AraC-like DNA-binding protein
MGRRAGWERVPPIAATGTADIAAALAESPGGVGPVDPGPPAPRVQDSVVLARFLLSAASSGGADARQLAMEARIPGWALAADVATLPSRNLMRLWELFEHAMEDPDLPMTMASRHQSGRLDIFDYMFTTAATVRDGFRATQDYMHLLTSNVRMQVEAETGRDVTYSYRHVEPGDRAEELTNEFAMAVFCARAQVATGRPIVPARLAFAFPAPRSHRALVETLGTRRIDFDAPVTTITFSSADLDLPLLTADPALAGILRRYAATMPPPPVASWQEHFRRLLAESLNDGSQSLDTLARRLAVSRRTLQRQLAEHGTSWRAELDAARRRRAQDARQRGTTDLARLARHMGYADPRSASRALRQWRDPAP